MKSILTLFAAIIAGAISVFAQDLVIIKTGGNHHLNDSVIVMNGTAADSIVTVTDLKVVNTAGATLKVKVRRVDSTVVAGSENYLCWGSCYAAQSATVWVTPGFDSIQSGDTNNTFTGDYEPHGYLGTEIIKYIFFNSVNPNDSSWVIVKYVIAPLGIAQINPSTAHVSAPYPNPANNNVSFNYNLKGAQHGTMEIYNSIGRCVQTTPVSAENNKLSISVANLPSGIYICKLQANGGNPVYQRLVVAH